MLTDHDRAEVGDVLKEALAAETRYVGIMGNPKKEGPHVAALRSLGVPEEQIYSSGLCTAMHLDVLTSYRAEKDAAGRLAGVIRAGA